MASCINGILESESDHKGIKYLGAINAIQDLSTKNIDEEEFLTKFNEKFKNFDKYTENLNEQAINGEEAIESHSMVMTSRVEGEEGVWMLLTGAGGFALGCVLGDEIVSAKDRRDVEKQQKNEKTKK